jgi:hypothetical protein
MDEDSWGCPSTSLAQDETGDAEAGSRSSLIESNPQLIGFWPHIPIISLVGAIFTTVSASWVKLTHWLTRTRPRRNTLIYGSV